VPHLLLEGKADRYASFLTTKAKASLEEASEDFHFQIRTTESPGLLLRYVSTHGQASNHSELPDAFFALMLSFNPGGYSSTTPLSDSSPLPTGPSLHWHFANSSCVNHHRNSKVTYLRMESTDLLRELSAQGIPVSQLACLQGAAAPESLLQLIEVLGLQLADADVREQVQLTEVFFKQLGQELRLLLGPPTTSDANAAGHVLLAIGWMLGRLSEPISLQKLATEISLTPRSVQACFKSVLAISPMRWLKLARISNLRQFLWCGDMAHLSIQQLMGRCGLSDTSLNRQYYRDAYGVSPMEDRREAEYIKKQDSEAGKVSRYYKFSSTKAAIQYLEGLIEKGEEERHNYQIAMVINPPNT
jgi:AraC-like DNA-binding protein